MINPDSINAGINIISLAQEFGLEVNNENKIHCLLHSEQSPSMQLYQDHAFCFGCNKRLDAIGMAQKVKGFNFKEAAEYLAKRQGIELFEKPNKKSIDANTCLNNSLWQKRMNILTQFHEHITNRVDGNGFNSQCFDWIKNRGYDLNFLIEKDFLNQNFLTLNDPALDEFKNKIGIEELKEVELLKNYNQFSWLGGNYNLAFPCWYPLLNKEMNSYKWKVTSLKIRHTGTLTEKSTKEVELVLPNSLKDLYIPSSLGFYGLKYWASIYPQVFNQCEGLTVYITEGPTDMVAGFHLLHEQQDTIVLSAGSIQKATHGYNLELVKKCKKFVVAFDNDEAGISATKKLIEAARKNGIFEIAFIKFLRPDIKDLNDILKVMTKSQEELRVKDFFEIVNCEAKKQPQFDIASSNSNLKNLEINLRKEFGKIENFDPIAYVKGFLCSKNYTIHPSGYAVDEKNQSINSFMNDLEVQAYYDGVKSTDSKMLEKAFLYIVSQYKKEIIEKLRIKMEEFVPDANNNMAKFIKALTGIEETQEEYSFILFCFEHFIRQVKLKICGLPVYQELMLVIVGGQNQGKTTAIRNLLSTICNFFVERGLQDISNPEKNCQMFEDNFVILCEEMQNADKTSIETFKSIVTSSEISARKYHSQMQMKIKNNSTLIGTSNKPTSEGIFDTTGMRRFIDIEIKIPKCDFNELNAIDYVALWQGVQHIYSPEEKEEFYKIYNTMIAPKQEEMRAKDCIEDFLEDQKIQGGEILCPTSKAYERYRQWCGQNGYNHPKNSRSFSKRLIRLLKIPIGKNYKDSQGNRALPLNEYVELINSYYMEL